MEPIDGGTRHADRYADEASSDRPPVEHVLADDAIICCDTGTVTTWAARHIKIKGTMEFSASGTLATMACGLPYAVGAAVAHPGRQVVCFAGDGGFTMLMGELATS